MKCDHCGNEVPEGVFCTACGAHQGTTGELPDPKRRAHSYAAQPGEHVSTPSVMTTLFPHLGMHKVNEYRWALFIGLAGILILYMVGLVSAGLMAAAFIIPVLYLLYLYEAQVYREEPVVVLGVVVIGGIVVGAIVTLAISYTFDQIGGGSGFKDVAAAAVLVIMAAIVQEVLKPIPAFLVRGRGFRESMDGLVFGIAAGLGFALAETLVRFWDVITGIPWVTEPGNWVFTLITVAVLQPLMQGSATGLIAVALWKGKLGSRQVMAVAVALGGHIVFSLAGTIFPGGFVFEIIVDTLVVAGLLISVRHMLHAALLEEAVHAGFKETVCPNCHRTVNASSFCPNCGLALSAAPRRKKAAAVAVGEPAAAPGLVHRLPMTTMLGAVLAVLVVSAALGAGISAAAYQQPAAPDISTFQDSGLISQAVAQLQDSDFVLTAAVSPKPVQGGPAQSCSSAKTVCVTVPKGFKWHALGPDELLLVDSKQTGATALAAGSNQQPSTPQQTLAQVVQGLSQVYQQVQICKGSQAKTVGFGGIQGVMVALCYVDSRSNPGHAAPGAAVVWVADSPDGKKTARIISASAPGQIKAFGVYAKSAVPIYQSVKWFQ